DAGDHQALAAGARNGVGRSQRQPEMRHAVLGLPRSLIGLGLLVVRHLLKRERQLLLLTLALDAERDLGARRQRADLLGEIARILDGVAVDRGDDVSGFDAGFRGRAVGLRLIDDGTFDVLHAEAFGHALGDALDLDAGPAALDE